jgi:Sulfotransferase domain
VAPPELPRKVFRGLLDRLTGSPHPQKGLVEGRNSGGPPAPVFHITHPKAGSQWVYAVLHHLAPEAIVKPQILSRHVVGAAIAPHAIYPAVYLPRSTWLQQAIPENARVFVVLRDLRDSLVSLYFSKKFSHPILLPAHESDRAILRGSDLGAGMEWLIRERLGLIAEIQRSWRAAGAPILTYEQLLEAPEPSFRRIIDIAGLAVSDAGLEAALSSCSFETQSGGRARGLEDVNSHQRVGVRGDWRRHLGEEMSRKIRERFPDAYYDDRG